MSGHNVYTSFYPGVGGTAGAGRPSGASVPRTTSTAPTSLHVRHHVVSWWRAAALAVGEGGREGEGGRGREGEG